MHEEIFMHARSLADASKGFELDRGELERVAQSVLGGAENVQDVYPLSPLQEGMLFHHRMNEHGDTYVLSTLFEMHSRRDAEALGRALQQTIDRHDVLRAGVLWENLPRPVQVVYRKATLGIEELSLEPDSDVVSELKGRMKPQRQRFDLTRAPLLRLQIATDPRSSRWYALLQVHHIICDHQSLRALVAEALASMNGRQPRPGETIAFKEVVAGMLAGPAKDDSKEFFRARLAEIREPTAPFGFTDIHGDGDELEEVHRNLDEISTQRIRVEGRRLGLSPARLFHAAWALVVAQTSGREDVVFGTVLLTNRQPRSGAQRALGMFVNTLPLRVRLANLTASELVDETHRELTDLVTHAHAPLTLAQQCSAVPSGSPLFTTIFNFRHNVADAAADDSEASGVRVLSRGEAWSNYPISVTVDDQGDCFELTVQTDRRIGAMRMASYLALAVQNLVDALRQAPDRLALDIAIMSEAERELLIDIFNKDRAPYPSDRTLHELFEMQALATPQAAAVVWNDSVQTYDELRRKSDQLAHYLRRRGIKPGVTVGLCVERGIEMLVGVFGVLKAGGAYVPLDPDYPAERLAYMLRDAAPPVLLTQSSLLDRLRGVDAEIVALDDWRGIDQTSDEQLVLREASANDLAYVIYTSGSTGKPKGVMIEHRHVLNLWEGLQRLYALTGGCQRIALNASLNFDASVQQVVQLLSGRTVCIVPQPCRRDATLLVQWLREQRIEAIDCTPSQLNAWIAAGLLEDPASQLKLVLVGGEAIDAKLWSRLAQCKSVQFFNVYGPTECTVDSTVAHINGDSSTPHIGRPLSNRHVYILDERERLAPMGVAGEIYIGGAGIARGYLHRPELTAERFRPDPFDVSGEDRMYKTGDVGRWRSDGTIEYLGRNDDQVKIRGFRIELGEITAQLQRHEQVSEALVVACEAAAGEKRLVGYVVPKRMAEPPTIEVLRAHLEKELPEHMVPGAFVTMESMPLTPSGKLDRRALPPPDAAAFAIRAYEPPQGENEELLAEIWRELLRVERVGRNDNFFELGGHSLLIMQLLERLRRAGRSCDVRSVFDKPTLAGLATVLASAAAEQLVVPPNLIPPDCRAIAPELLPLVDLKSYHLERIERTVPGGAANIQDIYPLAPLQEGILFHYLLEERGGDVYVVPMLLSVCSRERVEALVSALQFVIDRHDVLRTAILWEQLPQPVQVVLRHAPLPVDWNELDPQVEALAQIEEWMKPDTQRLDLRAAPLMRLRVAHHRDAGWFALLQLHHIVGDNASQTMLIAEAVAQLEGRAHGLPPAAPYRNHVAHVLARARTQGAEDFFSRKLADVDEPTAPFGLLDVHGDGSVIAEARLTLDVSLGRRLRTHARQSGVSVAALFHAAWALVVARTSNRNDVVFGSVLLGRLQGAAGAQRTLGMFINTLPLRLRLEGLTAEALLERTQAELVDLMSHEQASLAIAQRCSGIVGTAPLFTALFNYRHRAWIADSDWDAASGVHKLSSYGYTNYPVTMSVDEQEETFELTAQTNRRIDPVRMTTYLATAIESLVEALEQAPRMPALALSVMPQQEHRYVIESLNATAAAYARDKLIHELFEEQVVRTPDRIAVSYNGCALTYEQLNHRANQLARSLRNEGVRPDHLVGICVERSVEMVIALVATLKAGAAYLPMDPSHPVQRLQLMIEDAGPLLVLMRSHAGKISSAQRTKVIDLDERLRTLDGERVENLSRADTTQHPSDLLYVIFTSGSTGRPKGTAMSHAAMVNLIEWHRSTLSSDRQRVMQFAALNFDVAFQDVFSTLCTGGTLLLLDEQTRRDARALLNVLCREAVTRIFMPPLMLQALAESSKATGGVPHELKDVIAAGEQLRISPEIVEFFESLPGARLHNHYGPTETHVVTALTLSGEASRWPALPTIGRPIANTRIYILDEQRQPVPYGAIGEIYIAGANLARGYLHRPELTEQRFLRDPFDSNPLARMYRTGDLGRWRTDATIEYLGRNDDQVKIRGYRIELAEIEAQLTLHAAVREAAVIAREDAPGEKRLVAYVTASGEAAPNADSLRAHLKGALPEYMVPSAFVVLEKLPLTSSGKLARRALPPPDPASYAARRSEPPRGEVEERLAGIWEELVRVKNVGRDDDFFELGAHSLLVLKAVARIEQSFGCTLSVSDFYRTPRLQDLARRIGGSRIEEEYVDLRREAVLSESLRPAALPCRQPAQAILLTGATGFVGRFLLSQLLQETDATIYCLVRLGTHLDASRRLRNMLVGWDLWREEFEHRIVAVPGDLRLRRLGVDDGMYGQLVQRVDAIYHCGTSMNHLESYAMAKAANVDSASELLAMASAHRAKPINFISTLGVFRAPGDGSSRVVHESTAIDEERHLASMGYVASKWVAEKTFMLANRRGVPCNVFRVGLVWADSQRGRYDELQRGYRIVKSSLMAGAGIAGFNFEMPPTPVDYVARAIVHLAGRHPDGGGVFHISASRQPPHGIFESWNSRAVEPLELLPLYDWIRRIKQLHEAGRSLPIVPLVEYAFSMDEQTFHEQQSAAGYANIAFDCEATHRELKRSGIVAPTLDEQLVERTVNDMLSRDQEIEMAGDSEAETRRLKRRGGRG